MSESYYHSLQKQRYRSILFNLRIFAIELVAMNIQKIIRTCVLLMAIISKYKSWYLGISFQMYYFELYPSGLYFFLLFWKMEPIAFCEWNSSSFDCPLLKCIICYRKSLPIDMDSTVMRNVLICNYAFYSKLYGGGGGWSLVAVMIGYAPVSKTVIVGRVWFSSDIRRLRRFAFKKVCVFYFLSHIRGTTYQKCLSLLFKTPF